MIKPGSEVTVVNAICGWIESKIEDAGLSNAVFGLSGGADSALVAILCRRKFRDAVGVIMPCYSSPGSEERARELALKFEIVTTTVNLNVAHDSIIDQIGIQNNDHRAGAFASLKSCLRAPVLDFVAKTTGGLVIGTGNRDEDGLVRYYNKRGDGAVDINPIAHLHKSEVYQLLRYLGCPQSIIDAAPSADLYDGQTDENEMGLTYDEIEWATKLEDKHRIITTRDVSSVSMPASVFMNMTPRQLHVIQKIREMEHASRHKISLPECYLVRHHAPGCFDK